MPTRSPDEALAALPDDARKRLRRMDTVRLRPRRWLLAVAQVAGMVGWVCLMTALTHVLEALHVRIAGGPRNLLLLVHLFAFVGSGFALGFWTGRRLVRAAIARSLRESRCLWCDYVLVEAAHGRTCSECGQRDTLRVAATTPHPDPDPT